MADNRKNASRPDLVNKLPERERKAIMDVCNSERFKSQPPSQIVRCNQTEGVVKNGKATSGHQRYLCRNCKKSFQLDYSYNTNQSGTHERIIDMTMNGSCVRDIGRVLKISPTTVIGHLKNSHLVR